MLLTIVYNPHLIAQLRNHMHVRLSSIFNYTYIHIHVCVYMQCVLKYIYLHLFTLPNLTHAISLFLFFFFLPYEGPQMCTYCQYSTTVLHPYLLICVDCDTFLVNHSLSLKSVFGFYNILAAF